MRILHVTDFHFCQPWFEWLGSHASEYDAVCFTGDFVTLFMDPQLFGTDSKPSSLTRLMRTTRVSNMRAQVRWIRDWLSNWPSKTPLFLCSGNHDYWPQQEHFIDTDAEGGWLRNARRPGIIWTDGSEPTLIATHRFLCVPWGRTPNPQTTEPHIVLVHAPPANTDVASKRGNDAGGDIEVTQAAQGFPPGSILLCGHVHQPRCWHAQIMNPLSGKPIWAFNPGYGATDMAEPNFIVLDTIARRAEYHAAGEVQSLSLPRVTE